MGYNAGFDGEMDYNYVGFITETQLLQAVLAAQESTVPIESNVYLNAIPDTSQTHQEPFLPGPDEELHQNFQIDNSEDQGTSGPQDSLLSDHEESPQTAESNLCNFTDTDDTLTQYEVHIEASFEDYEEDTQNSASTDQYEVGSQDVPVLPIWKWQLSAENDPNTPFYTQTPPQQEHSDHGTVEAITQTLQIYDSEIQGAAGTENMASDHKGSSPCAESTANKPLEAIKIYVTEKKGALGTNDMLIWTPLQFPLPEESNMKNDSNLDLSPIQQGECDKELFEVIEEYLNTCASEEPSTSVTQDLLASAVKEPLLPVEGNPYTSSLHDISPIQQSEIIPGNSSLALQALQIYASENPSSRLIITQERPLLVENNPNSPPDQVVYLIHLIQQEGYVPGAFEISAQISEDQGVSGTPEVRTNDRTRSVCGSAEKYVWENGGLIVCCKMPNQKETITVNNVPEAGSKISRTRWNSMNGTSKITSSSSTGSPNMFPSRRRLLDTDDETDRAECLEYMSLADLYSDYFKDLDEDQSEKYVVIMITSYVDIATLMISILRHIAAGIFTSPAGKLVYDVNLTDLSLAVDDEVILHDVCPCYKLRLLAVKAYIRKTCESTAEGEISETIRQEFLAEEQMAAGVCLPLPGDHNDYTGHTASRLQETGVSAEGEITVGTLVNRFGVTPAPNTSDITCGRGSGEGDEVRTEHHRGAHVNDRRHQRAAIQKIYSIAEQRVCRIRVINRVMLNCFKTVLNILGLGLQAKRLAQRAVIEVMKRHRPGTDHVVAAVVDLAIIATTCANTALKRLEEAVQLHRAVVGALVAAEKALHQLRVEARCGRSDLLDIIARVDAVEKAVQRACEIYLDKENPDTLVDASGAVRPPSQGTGLSDRPTPIMAHHSCDRSPRDVFEALFWATTSAVQAIDLTQHGLQCLSLSILFSAMPMGLHE